MPVDTSSRRDFVPGLPGELAGDDDLVLLRRKGDVQLLLLLPRRRLAHLNSGGGDEPSSGGGVGAEIQYGQVPGYKQAQASSHSARSSVSRNLS